MTDERKGGLALIAGSFGLIATMSFHPSGHDLFRPGALDESSALAYASHALAIAGMAVTLLGAIALSRRAASSDRSAVAALVAYGLSVVAGTAAAVASGFVGPGLVREILETTDAAARETWHAVLAYNFRVNQAFSRVLVVASSTAIVLWSAAIVRSRALHRAVALYGLLIGPAAVVAVLSGRLRLDVHGLGLVVLAQSAWFISTGVLLCRVRTT